MFQHLPTLITINKEGSGQETAAPNYVGERTKPLTVVKIGLFLSSSESCLITKQTFVKGP